MRRIENKLGIKGSPTCELVFTDAPALLVGDRKMGLIKYVMSLMNAARLGIAAQSTGLCEAAYREALKYAAEREQFGKPIIRFAAVSEMLSNMEAKTLAARALLYETARFVDTISAQAVQPPAPAHAAGQESPYAKRADIHGGSGFMKDYACERLYRDARIMNIYEGTTQLQVVAAINHVTKGGHLS